ncbi:hypothetical protein [Labrenzia sp. PHM005]|uniref:hypothetical protein n=1 Tax=Labrenzia sp. PHM005 TaxID=2590016 RepID=UPI00113FEF2C|nr:hypothetical protein [Labrenzia sp. PHM005]QDG78375.1 hypothetical protein FJ695_22320 [Labrenzia sp. PHM005]
MEVLTALDVERIKRVFPNEWQSILKRCATDPDLFEICEDIDRLAADVEKAEANFEFMSDCLKSDVLGSIDALVQEIREKIDLT